MGCCLCVRVATLVSASPVSFTGRAANDFAMAGGVTLTSSSSFRNPDSPNGLYGFDLTNVYFAYDKASDTGFFGKS
jgi:hypothetical protein